ncbi:MAG TPA: urate oxidase [Streptosporangiaceae bacterium]|nr:urate oxidase [Streptosporangiaceae bacterium]
MAIRLGQTQYGKAETRVVRIYRDGERHELRDLNVSTALRGDFAAAHLRGDQANVLPTDTQKNTCFAYAKERGVKAIEDYALALAGHFVSDIETVSSARVEVDEYRWERVPVAGTGHAHAFMRAGHEVRTAAVVVEAGEHPVQNSWVISGIKDLIVLKSTGSEFSGFLKDRYTTLAETTDRILATSLTARWRYAGEGGAAVPERRFAADGKTAWDEAFGQVREILLARFAQVHSLALQQTLYEMGAAVLAARDDIAEVRLSAPNKHHFLADLAPFGLANPGEVFYAADRPYGLIQCAVQRDDAPPAGPAWESPASFA